MAPSSLPSLLMIMLLYHLSFIFYYSLVVGLQRTNSHYLRRLSKLPQLLDPKTQLFKPAMASDMPSHMHNSTATFPNKNLAILPSKPRHLAFDNIAVYPDCSLKSTAHFQFGSAINATTTSVSNSVPSISSLESPASGSTIDSTRTPPTTWYGSPVQHYCKCFQDIQLKQEDYSLNEIITLCRKQCPPCGNNPSASDLVNTHICLLMELTSRWIIGAGDFEACHSLIKISISQCRDTLIYQLSESFLSSLKWLDIFYNQLLLIYEYTNKFHPAQPTEKMKDLFSRYHEVEDNIISTAKQRVDAVPCDINALFRHACLEPCDLAAVFSHAKGVFLMNANQKTFSNEEHERISSFELFMRMRDTEDKIAAVFGNYFCELNQTITGSLPMADLQKKDEIYLSKLSFLCAATLCEDPINKGARFHSLGTLIQVLSLPLEQCYGAVYTVTVYICQCATQRKSIDSGFNWSSYWDSADNVLSKCKNSIKPTHRPRAYGYITDTVLNYDHISLKHLARWENREPEIPDLENTIWATGCLLKSCLACCWVEGSLDKWKVQELVR